uniref:Putative monolaris n=1 Tax=Rhipicephalus pulchellus TaxID=72859 RepID=L7LTQ2_RHIPC
MEALSYKVLIFFAIIYGSVKDSDGSVKSLFRKQHTVPSTTTATTLRTLNTTDRTNRTSICSQTLEKGPCRARLEYWYYNSTTGNCSIFHYGGCKGNDNRFPTCQDCLEMCTDSSNVTEVCIHLEKEADDNDSWKAATRPTDLNESVLF